MTATQEPRRTATAAATADVARGGLPPNGVGRVTTTSRSRRGRSSPNPQAAGGDIDTFTPFGRIETAFIQLHQRFRPPPLLLPGDLIGRGDDQGFSPLDVRTVVINGPKNVEIAGQHIADRVWSYVGPRARARRDEWLLVAAGMALPGLQRLVTEVARKRFLIDWSENLPIDVVRLVHSDAVHRLVEALSGEEQPPFDLDKPYIYNRLIGHIRYATVRSPRRSSAPPTDTEWDAFEDHELHREPDTFRLPLPQLGDPLIILANHARRGNLTRVDAALLARTALCGQTRAQAIAAVRRTLPGVNGRTDEALRGRLERARQTIREIYHDELDRDAHYRTEDQPPVDADGSTDHDGGCPLCRRRVSGYRLIKSKPRKDDWRLGP